MKTRYSARAFIVAILVTGMLWLAGGSMQACTPKREAATIDIVKKKSDCALQNLNRSAEQMLADCAIPKDEKDVQDLLDVFSGAQAGAMKAGAKLPSSAFDAGMSGR